MRYLNAAAVGFLTGLGAAIVWIVFTVIVPVAIQMAQQAGNESGEAGAVTGGTFAPLAIFVVGFVGGCYGSLKRSRRNT